MNMQVSGDRLTGATRYRHGWLGGLILQVEEWYYCGTGRPQPYKESPKATRWRDAKVGDLISGQQIETLAKRS